VPLDADYKITSVAVDKQARIIYFLTASGSLIPFDIKGIWRISIWVWIATAAVVSVLTITLALPALIYIINGQIKLWRIRQQKHKMQKWLLAPQEATEDKEITEDWIVDAKELQIGEFLGDGAFSIVYEGVYRGRNVAIKKLKVDMQRNELHNEVNILRTVHHPNIVELVGISIDPRLIVMELVSGTTLERLLHKGSVEHQPVSEKNQILHTKLVFTTKLNILIGVAKGMRHLHNRYPPICHRDLKPSNILVSKRLREVKLCDFGVARFLSFSTMTGHTGTIQYMGPELILNDECCYTPACDVYR
jgi:tRNA A-37 threonylcarbamoyl transferase component Bud32